MTVVKNYVWSEVDKKDMTILNVSAMVNIDKYLCTSFFAIKVLKQIFK